MPAWVADVAKGILGTVVLAIFGTWAANRWERLARRTKQWWLAAVAGLVVIVFAAEVFEESPDEPSFVSQSTGADIRELLADQDTPVDLLIETAEDVAANERDTPEAFQYLSTAYLTGGRCEDARDAVEAGLELERTPSLVVNRGLVLRCEHDSDAALRVLQEAVREWPDEAEARFAYAMALRAEAGDDEAAAAQLAEAQDLLEQDDPPPLPPNVTRAEILVQLGSAYIALEDWPRAESALRAAIELDPHDANAHVLLGYYPLDEQGRYADALAAIRRGIELDPDVAYAHHALGWVLQNRPEVRDLRAAYDAFLEALDIDATFVSARLAIAHLIDQQGDLERAIEVLEDAPIEDVRISDALLQLYRRAGESQSFLDAMQARLDTTSDLATIPDEELRQCRDIGRAVEEHSTALQCGEVLVLVDPNDAWNLFFTAVIAEEAGTPRPELLERALDIQRSAAEISGTASDHEFVGYIYFELEQYDDAIAAYLDAVTAGGDRDHLEGLIDNARRLAGS